MRLTSSSLAAVVVVVVVGCGCGPNTLVGQPCETAGETKCEGDRQIRCDGSFYTALAECASDCVEQKDPVVHDEALLSDDETWLCTDGPHVVKQPITVGAGVTLSIEAGALLKMGLTSRIDTDLDGRIEALGTESATIKMTSESGDASGFGAQGSGGINVFARTAGEPSRLEHVIVERGINGLGVFGLSTDAVAPALIGNTLRDNTRFGVLVLCNEANAPLPDFAADGNQFFRNGEGDHNDCQTPP